MRGLKGYLRLLRRKIVKDKLPPEDVAAGWALGMFVGCAIPFGLQLMVSIPLAMMMRVSKVGATFGTLVTNPLSILVIYPAQTYAVDQLVFGGRLTFSKLMETEWTWAAVRQLGAETMVSFFLGGIFLGIILSPLTYFAVRRMVVAHRARLQRKAVAT